MVELKREREKDLLHETVSLFSLLLLKKRRR